MKCILHKTLQFIYSKRKQILFALFAFISVILDNNSDVLMCAAPAVVAGAAAAASGTSAAAGGAAATGAAAAGTGAATSGSAAAAGATNTSAGAVSNAANVSSGATTASNATNMQNNATMNVRNTDVPKNTNPKGTHSNTLSSNSVSSELNKPTEGFSEATDKSVKKDASMSETQKETKNSKNNRMNPEINKNDEEDEESQIDLENASKEITKDSSGMVVGCVFASIFILIFSIPIIMLLLINPTSSVMSQIDCSKQQDDNCKVDGEEEGFFSKLKNLFVYGAYGSNSEVVLEKIEDSYDDIKKEYDFVISLQLLSSSLFSDAEYINTKVENGKIVITDKMLERIKYIYDTALLQLIPKYNIYTCNAQATDGLYNTEEYTPSFEYSIIPTYEEDDTTEIDMELIPTGECDSSTVGTQYKKVIYIFDENLYFKRLKISEELDLVYADFVESDDLLVSKVRTQYNLYKNLYNVDEELGYMDVPVELKDDTNVNLQSPLKGWYYITSPFGNREGEFAGMHTGIDLVSSDKNIYAAGTGVVTRSNVETEGGNVIEITHTDKFGYQYVTQYAHLSERHVNVGDTINSGDIIGIMGDTGTMASGVHLHFSMWDKNTKDFYNPRKLFSNASNY